jgi:hypothetical protein
MTWGSGEVADGGGTTSLDDGSEVPVGDDDWQWFLQR